MKNLLALAVIAFSLIYGLSGCSIPTREIKVMNSKSEIHVKRVQLDQGDSVVCDPAGCRVVRQ